MKCSERSGIDTSSRSSRRCWYRTGSAITTASRNAARDARTARAQVGELLLSRAIQLPPVHASDAEPGSDILSAHPLFRRRRTLISVGVDASEELPLRLGVTPGVRLEPPALDRLHQRCHVTLLARLFERRVQILVVPWRMLASALAASTARIAVGVQAGRGRT
jgi:hypothetical protein